MEHKISFLNAHPAIYTAIWLAECLILAAVVDWLVYFVKKALQAKESTTQLAAVDSSILSKLSKAILEKPRLATSKALQQLGDFWLSFPKLFTLFKIKILLASTTVWAFLVNLDQIWNLDLRISTVHILLISVLSAAIIFFMLGRFSPLFPFHR